MQYLTPPLRVMRLTQPFGVDWTGVDLYRRLGMAGHNGLDLRAAEGTDVFACFDGELYVDNEPPTNGLPNGYRSGYGINVRIRSRELGLESIYGHLSETLRPHGGKVRAGDLVAKSGSTGISSGPHLHWGLREIAYGAGGSGPTVLNAGNGFFGSIDPMPHLEPGTFDLPVDRGYGVRPIMSDFQWYPTAAWFFGAIAKVEGRRRLPTTREKKAFVYGAWDFRTVVDDAMFQVWSEMTKPEAIRRGIIRKV